MKPITVLILVACAASGLVLRAARVHDEPLAPAAFEATLEHLRATARVPALAAAIVTSDTTVMAAAVGVRKLGDRTPVPVRRDDMFQVGSITKSITATIASTMVEEGLIRWETTIADAFPDLRASMDARYASVTLEMLLAHRAGVADRTDSSAWRDALRRTGTPREQRERFVRGVLALPPETEPGSAWAYSGPASTGNAGAACRGEPPARDGGEANFGYAIAGVMLERAANEPYESLVRRRVGEPLELHSLGFGLPATPGVSPVDQPWGHQATLLGFTPIAPRPEADNPPAIAPAAAVHLSILDLARYAAFHLRAVRGGGGASAFLYRPRSENGYALGWLAADDERACGGRAVAHNGSNGSFYALVWLAPACDAAIVMATNADGERVRSLTEGLFLDALLRHLQLVERVHH